MAVTAKLLKDIMTEARPIIERQMNDAKLIAGFRDVVAAAGGDWGALKALIKAHVEDENDETGEGKRVQKIRDKADSTSAYADMLGLANMNENNFSAPTYAEQKGIDPKLVETVAQGMQTEIGRKALVTALDIMIEREENAETNSPETAPERPSVEAHDAEAHDEASEIAADAPIVQGDQANMENGHVDCSAERASSAVKVGATNSPEMAHDLPAASGTDRRLSVAGPKDAVGRQSVDTLRAERGRPGDGVTAGETATNSHSAPPSSRVAEQTEAGALLPSASVAHSDVPAFLKAKEGCQRPGACKTHFTSVLCSGCANERAKKVMA